MTRTIATVVVACFACAAPAAHPPPVPISSELFCSQTAPIPALEPEERERCHQAILPRLDVLKHAILRSWQPTPNTRGTSTVQLQFGLDAEGLLVDVCVLGGTGDAEARSALAAVRQYRPAASLTAGEMCVVGDLLVSTFTVETTLP